MRKSIVFLAKTKTKAWVLVIWRENSNFLHDETIYTSVSSTRLTLFHQQFYLYLFFFLIKGCLQRLDYNVLVPFLQPKHEYVLCISLTPFQKKLYEHYLENFARAGQIGADGKLEGGRKGGLFYDVQNLSRVWNHPYILLKAKVIWYGFMLNQGLLKTVAFIAGKKNPAIQNFVFSLK